ncbi:hypothetical protein MMC14_003785 [Varicellaria rhodocarpa]|nr:hypothetical protein [Varicellaria rhodocarpa]
MFVLRHGGNPNELCVFTYQSHPTIWEYMLECFNKSLMDPHLLADEEYLQLTVRLMITCLESGANTEVNFEALNPSDPAEFVSVDVVIERLEELEAQGYEELRQLFEENRAKKILDTAPSVYREPSPVKLKRPRTSECQKRSATSLRLAY